MLRIFSNSYDRTCEGISRRELFRVGALGLTSVTLPSLLATKARAAGLESPVRDKAVVFLFLGGGPPQHETFDPKMSAPSEYRAMFGEVKTELPGVTFGATFEGLAKRADKLSVVRSFRPGSSSHGIGTTNVVSGGNLTEAALGSVYASVTGTTNSHTGMPTNVMLGPAAAGATFKGSPDYTQRCSPVGTLDRSLKPFDPSGGGQLKKNMELSISPSRLDDRRSLLTALDDVKRTRESQLRLSGVDKFNQQAFDVLVGGVTDAFDLKQEDPRTLAAYDTSHIKIPNSVFVKKKGKKGFENQTPEYLGKQMLLARRMIEAGCGFVTVTSTGWDLHGNRFGVDDGMPVLGSAVDHAVGAFLDDLEQRGMSDDVLLVVTGEFGRTPKINAKAGRDHWGNLCPLMFAGGGLNMGQVIGQSDKIGGTPATDPVTLPQVSSTVLRTLFDPGILRLHPDVPTEINAAVAAEPIAELVS